MEAPDREHLRQHFASLTTQELIRLYQANVLVEGAVPLLIEELARRGTDVCNIEPGSADNRGAVWLIKAKRRGSRWAQVFALVGSGFAALVSILAGLNGSIPAILEPLVLPAYFIFALFDWRGEIGLLVIFAVATNAIVWAGLGWILGYGSSR